jgi:hypothetical protein
MQICEPFLAWRVPKGHVTAFANGLCYSAIPHYRSVCSVKQCSSKVPLIGARRAADDSAVELCSQISPCDTRFLTRQCFLFARTNSKCQSGTIYRGTGATLGWFRGGTQHQSNRISTFGRSFLAALSSSSRNDDEQTGDMREGVSEKLDKSQKVYEGMKNQIDKYKPSDAAQGRLQADEDDQDDDGEDAVPRHTRGQRARTTRPRQAADSGQQDSDVNLQKIMRACHRRVRAGGAGAVSSSVATLSAALMQLEKSEDKEIRGADYDMVITFCLEAYGRGGRESELKEGLKVALDLVATGTQLTCFTGTKVLQRYKY